MHRIVTNEGTDSFTRSRAARAGHSGQRQQLASNKFMGSRGLNRYLRFRQLLWLSWQQAFGMEGGGRQGAVGRLQDNPLLLLLLLPLLLLLLLLAM